MQDQMKQAYEKNERAIHLKLLLFVLGCLALFTFSIFYLKIDIPKFVERLGNTPDVLRRMAGIDWAIVPDLLEQTLVTIFLVVLSLTGTVILSFLLSFLAADNTAPWRWLATLIKAVITIIRAIPSLILALIIVASIGFGYTPAIIILTLVGVATLTRLFIGSIEDAGTDIIEALDATGSSWAGTIIHGVFPIVLTAFLSWFTIQIENTISLSISLGVLGIQGVGLLLSNAQMNYQFTTVTTIILYIFINMFLLEYFMQKVREKISG